MVVYYKSVRYIDGKLKKVIADESGDVVKNPTKEQIEMAILENSDHYKRIKYKRRGYKYKGRECCKCKIDLSEGDYHGIKDYDEEGNWDGKSYLCWSCYMKKYNKDRNARANWRTGNLSRYSPSGKGFIGAQIVAKTYGIYDCNIIMDNFNFYIDLSKHSEYGYVEVKTATLNIERGNWKFALKMWKQFDTLILVCMDQYEPWKNVKRVYAIPCEYVMNQIGVTITEAPSSKGKWEGTKWGQFRLDERQFIDTYHKMDITKCKVLRKDE